jgi:hypothetical protein
MAASFTRTRCSSSKSRALKYVFIEWKNYLICHIQSENIGIISGDNGLKRHDKEEI